MKSSALVFLAAFVALSASWGGFVLAPQLQLGRATQGKVVPSGVAYPTARPGLASQGAEVYRSLGCVYCHSQQVGQEKTIAEIVLTDAGTNTFATLAVLAELKSTYSQDAGKNILGSLPQTIMQVPATDAATPILKRLAEIGAKAGVRVSQHGTDLTRGWGRRATVAADYLFESPVQPGTRRIGPDLANVGQRRQDVNWHLRHLYAPKSVVNDSTMPPYRFLFTERKLKPGQVPSPDAIPLTASGEFFDVSKDTGPVTHELVPTEAGRTLAAYLVSLRADAPLFEAPFTAPALPADVAPATNSPAPAK